MTKKLPKHITNPCFNVCWALSKKAEHTEMHMYYFSSVSVDYDFLVTDLFVSEATAVHQGGSTHSLPAFGVCVMGSLC